MALVAEDCASTVPLVALIVTLPASVIGAKSIAALSVGSYAVVANVTSPVKLFLIFQTLTTVSIGSRVARLRLFVMPLRLTILSGSVSVSDPPYICSALISAFGAVSVPLPSKPVMLTIFTTPLFDVIALAVITPVLLMISLFQEPPASVLELLDFPASRYIDPSSAVSVPVLLKSAEAS